MFSAKKTSLLSNNGIDVLQDIIRKRDQTNNGVSRAEAVSIIVDLGQAKSMKSAENHLDYLIRKGRLDKLRRNGRIVTAQATTTERCQVNTRQQFRWHYMIESEWEHLRQVNQPTPSFINLHPHFQLNLDESCFMCSEGNLRIIGDAARKHHDKNISDNRLSITVLRCGSAAGTHGPVIFLLKGTEVNQLFTKKKLQENYGLPEGSCVLMNENAYMDDETWERVVDILAPALRKLKVIKEHPDWWTLLTYDGFKSHVNVNTALKTFHDNKIRVVKEEAGTSHVNQPYDQGQAKADKRAARQLLDLARARVSSHIDQWQLCAILCVALKHLPEQIWVKSFRKVNLHPDYRVSFKEWLKKIDSHVTTGDTAYTRSNEDSIYDAMPAFWKAMKVEERQKVLQRIKTLTNEVGQQMWLDKTHILSLSECVPLNQVPKLRICYQAAQAHPDVIVGSRIGTITINDENRNSAAPDNDNGDTEVILVETPNTSSTQQQLLQTNSNHQLNSFMLLPPSFLKAIDEAKTNIEKVSTQKKLFAHTVQFRNRTNYDKETLCVSDYLDVEVTSDQQRLLNPTVLDTVAGFILKDSQGQGAKKRLPQRRLNLIDGHVSAHCSVLNSEERMNLIRLSNEVAAVLGDIHTDRTQEKEKNRVRKEQEEAEKAQRSIARLEKEKEAQEKGLELCKKMMEELAQKGSAHIKTYTVANLKDLLRYEFKSDVYKQQGIKKDGLVDAATQLYQQKTNGNEEANGNEEVNNNENNAAFYTSASDVCDVARV